MKVGILYSDGNFSKSRNNSLLGQEGVYIYKLLTNNQISADLLSVNIAGNSTRMITSAEELNEYSHLILFACTTNQWGGELNVQQCYTYRLLHDYTGKLYCWFEDARIPLEQLSKQLSGRKFWLDNPLCELEELELPNMNILSIFKDEDITRKLHKSINVDKVYQIPVYVTHMDSRSCNEPLFGKTVDLIYGGFGRSKARNNFYIEYFLTRKNISTELYGTMKDKDLSGIPLGNCYLSGKVPYSEVLSKNATGLCTIIPAEKNYNNNCITPRIIEALRSKCICFIENDFDSLHTIFKDDFFYVSSGDELETKILSLKRDKNLYNEKLTYQQNVLTELLNVDFSKLFIDILKI